MTDLGTERMVISGTTGVQTSEMDVKFTAVNIASWNIFMLKDPQVKNTFNKKVSVKPQKHKHVGRL
jgi:hypothetical protein